MLTQELVQELFSYESGNLIRIKKVSNNTNIGDVVGSIGGRGYRMVYINNKNYALHRVLFLHQKGYLPESIDHIDCNPLNNKIENLRGCTKGQNSQNTIIRKDNESGVKCVYWHKASRKWVAGIRSNGSYSHLGCFDDIDVAKQVLSIERLRLHGEFANHG